MAKDRKATAMELINGQPTRSPMARDFPAIELPRAADAVTQALIDGIRAGIAPIGSHLPRDLALAEHFGVSRLVVRDALGRLRRGGIVDIRSGPGGGAQVTSLAIPTDLLTSLDTLGRDEIRELLETRRAIEEATAPLAAMRANRRDLAELIDRVEALDSFHDDPESFIELDVRFHLRIAAAANNRQLAGFLRLVFRDLAAVRSRYPIEYGSMRAAEKYQCATLEAVRSGNPDRASASIDAHLRALEEHFLS